MKNHKEALITHQIKGLEMMLDTMKADHNKSKESGSVNFQCYHIGALSVIETLSLMVKELNKTINND